MQIVFAEEENWNIFYSFKDFVTTVYQLRQQKKCRVIKNICCILFECLLFTAMIHKGRKYENKCKVVLMLPRVNFVNNFWRQLLHNFCAGHLESFFSRLFYHANLLQYVQHLGPLLKKFKLNARVFSGKKTI